MFLSLGNMYRTETDTQITQRSPYSAFQEESIPLIASAIFYWKETKNLFWWQKYRYCCFLDAARFCFSLHWSTSLVSGSCKDLVYFHVVKKNKKYCMVQSHRIKINWESTHCSLAADCLLVCRVHVCANSMSNQANLVCVCLCVCAFALCQGE